MGDFKFKLATSRDWVVARHAHSQGKKVFITKMLESETNYESA